MRFRVLIAVASVAAILGACGQPAVGPVEPTRAVLTTGAMPDAGRVLVKVESDQAGRRAAATSGATVLAYIPALRVMVLELPAGASEAVLAGLRAQPGVIYAEPDAVATVVAPPPGKGWDKESPSPSPSPSETEAFPNDPQLAQQWGHVNIRSREAWAIETGSATVTVAILDTGIDQDHEDLDPQNASNGASGKIVADVNFTDSGTVDDRYGHGTHVAGIAAAGTNNNVGVAGTGFDVRLANVKVLNDRGSGYYSWVINGIVWAADNGANVINMSLGGTSGSQALSEAVAYAASKNVVIVAAAGNSNTSSPSYPAHYTPCIAVAATDQQDQKASFSNFGPWVDVAAPGVDIRSTMPNHRNRIGLLHYGDLDGTSMAAPFVAGQAALLWSTGRFSLASAVRNEIETTCDAPSGTGSTKGRINIERSVL